MAGGLKVAVADILMVMGLVLVTAGLGLKFKDQNEESKVEVVKGAVIQSDNKVKIDISGAVAKPGLYSMDRGSRVEEALVAAGGLTKEADRVWVEANLNRAEKIWDGMKIYVPAEGVSVQHWEDTGGKININTAGQGELEKLPEVGPAMAKKILEYRQKNEGFKKKEELMLVPGIGEKTYEKLKELVAI